MEKTMCYKIPPGPEALAEEDVGQPGNLVSEIIPYMELHCNPSRLEQGNRLASGDTLTPEETWPYWGIGGLRHGVPSTALNQGGTAAGNAAAFRF